MKSKIKNVLVTGAGGFVGSHLVEHLIERGYNVRCFVRYNSRNDHGLLSQLPAAKLSQIEVIAGDLRDYNAIYKAVQQMDIIFHLGALIAIPYSYKHPREVIETNVLGTLNVLEAALHSQVERVVHTSTSEVYGSALYVPIDETHPLQGQSPYSASKISADKIAESFYRSYKLPIATIRPFNIYGPRQSARAVIPTIIMQALSQKEIHLGNLSPTRDFTFVADTVRGFQLIAETDSAVGKTLNIGSNYEISIKDLAAKIIHLCGSEAKILQEDNRFRPTNSEVDRLWAENRLAAEVLNWHPEVGLDVGLRRTIDWIKDHLNRYQTGEYVV